MQCGVSSYDNPTSKQPKHVPAVETCEYSGIQNYFHSSPLHNRDFLTFLPIEVAAFQIYPSKLPLMPPLESVQSHVNYLKSIKQKQMLEFGKESQEPEQ